MQTDDKTGINSIKRAIQILNLFQDEKYLGITEMSRQLNLSKTTIFRVVRTLESEGWLIQGKESTKYRLGFEILTVASSLCKQYDFKEIAVEVMTNLKDVVNETVILSTYTGNHGVCIEKVDSENKIKLTSEVGQIIPLHAGATGKSILANLPQEEREKVISQGLSHYTDLTLTDAELLEKDLVEIRKKGYSCSYGETDEGVMAVGAPIFDQKGRLLYSLSVAGPRHRMEQKGETFLIENVLQAAKQMMNMLQMIV